MQCLQFHHDLPTKPWQIIPLFVNILIRTFSLSSGYPFVYIVIIRLGGDKGKLTGT